MGEARATSPPGLLRPPAGKSNARDIKGRQREPAAAAPSGAGYSPWTSRAVYSRALMFYLGRALRARVWRDETIVAGSYEYLSFFFFIHDRMFS